MEISLEEKTAIEFFKLQSGHWKDFMRKKGEKTIEDIIINLIEKQQKEIEKKDRQIDLMAEYIEEYTGDCPCDMYDWHDIDCEKVCEDSMKKCWKQYFKNKTEEN